MTKSDPVIASGTEWSEAISELFFIIRSAMPLCIARASHKGDALQKKQQIIYKAYFSF